MKKMILMYWPVLAVTSLGMVSCSEDTVLKSDTLSQKWQQALNGQGDNKQNWVTAINMQFNIIDKNGSVVSAYTIGGEKPVLLAQKEMKGNGVMRLDIPQGVGNSIGLISDSKDGRIYQRIYLSNDNQQVEDVDFINGTNSSVIPLDLQKAKSRVISNTSATPLPNQSATHNSGLDGNTVTPTNGYLNFGGWAWEALLEALPEGKRADKKNTSDGISYEFTSDGYQGQGKYGDNTIVNLSYLYGYTGCNNSRIIGYYTHSEGTYSDLELHDLGECLTKDYLASPGSTDYQSKVQYQLDGKDKWYDANFWYTDGEGVLVDEYGKKVTAAGSKSAFRAGDGVYNSFLVHNNYGERVSAMRGLTYKFSIPKGKKYGFYLRIDNESLTDAHKTILQNKGVDVSKITTEINFSNKDLNQAMNGNIYFRSSYKKYDNFSFIGFDDGSTSGDADCNDVTLGFLDADGKPGPHVYNEADELQSWTIGYENQGMDADFDFNDVVIKVTPNPVTHKAKVELMAAGGIYKTELYFGSKKLCEVHEAFGETANEKGEYDMVNTESASSMKPTVDLGEVDWPADYTMTQNGSLFNTKVYVKDKEYTASPGTYIGNDKDVPTAVCVAGDWQWPKEYTNIFDAYPLIGQWGKNVTNSDYWNWYGQPKSGNVMGSK